MQVLLILLPLTAYLLLVWLFIREASFRDLGKAFIKAHLILFSFIAVSCEVLSLFYAITPFGVTIAWIVLIGGAAIAVAIRRKRVSFRSHGGAADSAIRDAPGPRKKSSGRAVLGAIKSSLSPLEMVIAAFIIGLLVATLAAALLYPPNTWDSMTYHMPRVMHWIENQSVRFYATPITRQNYQMPLAEFAILHLQILTQTDLFANLIQWESYVMMIILSVSLSVSLGLSRGQQWIAAAATASIPMAVLQASSTQNDLVTAAFVMIFAQFLMRMQAHPNGRNAMWAGLAFGLAILTKGTAYLYCAGVGLMLGMAVLYHNRKSVWALARASGWLAAVVLLGSLINTGIWIRNYQLYGHPLSTETAVVRNVDLLSATALASNMVRNTAMHLGTPSSRLNRYAGGELKDILGDELDNPETTFGNTVFDIPFIPHEDYAGNGFHMAAALCLIVILPWMWKCGHYPKTIVYAFALLLSALLYCWYLKWQPWASRLHTPLFAMATPLMAIALIPRHGRLKQAAGTVFLIGMLLMGSAFALKNRSRPLASWQWVKLGRDRLYFQNRPELFDDYHQAAKTLAERRIDQAGLLIVEDGWEYPLWMLTRGLGQKTAFHHVGVPTPSGRWEQGGLPPVVLSIRPLRDWKRAPDYETVRKSYLSVSQRLGPP